MMMVMMMMGFHCCGGSVKDYVTLPGPLCMQARKPDPQIVFPSYLLLHLPCRRKEVSTGYLRLCLLHQDALRKWRPTTSDEAQENVTIEQERRRRRRR